MKKTIYFPSVSFLAIAIGCALGVSLLSAPAIGYPTTAVSLGTNPVIAEGGEVGPDSTVNLFEEFLDSEFVITDVVLTIYGYQGGTDTCKNRVSLDSATAKLAQYHLTSDTYYNGTYLQPTSVSHTYSSGLPVASGAPLTITNHDGSCSIGYSVSGYRAAS
jgi:hypothetical protein